MKHDDKGVAVDECKNVITTLLVDLLRTRLGVTAAVR
jgi:hypothetical protein